MADKRISQLIERTDILNNDVLPIVASGATTTNKVTISTIQEWMQDNLDVGVTSVGITIGSTGTDINVTGSPITTSGNITINIPTASATNRGLLSSSDWTSFNNKLSSVGLTMPSAFTVSNSPLTANGTIAVTGAGTVAQYIRGDGSLADFPEAGGGGASVSYYLNGSVSQGTIGGIAYREMNKTPILGAGTNFTIAADGYIASFITDAGDPNLLLIPGGNWNLETYFAASSGGGTPSFYVELYKVDSGGTATLIASNSANPELIAFGTTTTAYFSSLAVPPTVLTLTDRLALRYYVTHSGRTITMHTEDANLCQVITTFTTGLTALNGLTAQVQNFATGTSGTDFNISSSSATHTFNLPDASASNRGAVTTGSQIFGGVKTFANGLSLSAVGGSNQVTRIVNIGTLHEGSATLNQIGFNSGNNIYFGKGLSNGGVISWNNAAVRYYTLPDADGTIALTSDLGNYIQGVGTADSIPKFTGARTIANSSIRDTTSTVVISKNVSVDNSASQAINLTPASGGTTNRIETTGTLPLAIITSGSSITLAAGGVTPQITLASTGAVTLTGALNGTSASFTGGVTSTGAKSQFVANGGDSAGAGISLNTTLTTNPTLRRNWGIFTEDQVEGDFAIKCSTAAGGNANTGNRHFFMTSTGAATFSSSVTTGASVNSGDSVTLLGELYWGGTTSGQKARAYTTGASGSATLNYSFWNGSTWQIVSSLASTGAATFSSSVTAGAIISTGVSTFSRAGLQMTVNPSYGGGDVYSQIQSTGALALASGGDNNRLYITSTGNVGIGTASPAQKLHVVGTSDGTKGRFELIGTGGINEVLQIVNSANYNPDRGVKMGLYVNQGTNSNQLGAEIGSAVSDTASAYMFFSTLNSGTIAERMRITSGGAVGIGTATPLITAADRGNLTINGSASSILTFGIAGAYSGYIYSSGTSLELDAQGARVIQFNTNGQDRMRITSGGEVLVGTTTSAGLATGSSVNTGVAITDGNILSQINNNSNQYWSKASGFTDGGFTAHFVNGNYVGGISTNGSTTTYAVASDYRLKEDFQEINGLEKVQAIKVYDYKWKESEDRMDGVLAHELQEVLPYAVIGEKDAERMQSVDYSKIVPVLIKAIQELTEQVEALKSQING